MRKCSIGKLDLIFAEIAKTRSLYMPVDTADGAAKYEKWQPGKTLSGALNTVKSPKEFFFPQTEDLVSFKTAGKSIEIVDTRSETEDFVIFGVRACDAKSMEILDRVFLTDPVDSFCGLFDTKL